MLKLSGWSRLTWGRDRSVRPPERGNGTRGPFGADPGTVRRDCSRGPVNHRSSRPPSPGPSLWANRELVGDRGRPYSAPSTRVHAVAGSRLSGGATLRDTQADVPSAGWLRAQLAFKDSMVHGILQFTPSIAFRYVLHRCESRDIRCRESFLFFASHGAADGRSPDRRARRSFRDSLARPAPGVGWCAGGALPSVGRGPRRLGGGRGGRGRAPPVPSGV